MHRRSDGSGAAFWVCGWLLLSFVPLAWCAYHAITYDTFEITTQESAGGLVALAARNAIYLACVGLAALYFIVNGIVVAVARASGLDRSEPVVAFLLLSLVAAAVSVGTPYYFHAQTKTAFTYWQTRAEPLVDAIRRYTADKGSPPPALAALVPDYLTSLPNLSMTGTTYRYATNLPTWLYDAQVPRAPGKAEMCPVIQIVFSHEGRVVSAEAQGGYLPPEQRAAAAKQKINDGYREHRLVGLSTEQMVEQFGKPRREAEKLPQTWELRLMTIPVPNDTLYRAANPETAATDAQRGVKHETVERWGDWVYCHAGVTALRDAVRQLPPPEARPHAGRGRSSAGPRP